MIPNWENLSEQEHNAIFEEAGDNIYSIMDKYHKMGDLTIFEYETEHAKYILNKHKYILNKNFTDDQIFHVYAFFYAENVGFMGQVPKGFLVDKLKLSDIDIERILLTAIIMNHMHIITFLIENSYEIDLRGFFASTGVFSGKKGEKSLNLKTIYYAITTGILDLDIYKYILEHVSIKDDKTLISKLYFNKIFPLRDIPLVYKYLSVANLFILHGALVPNDAKIYRALIHFYTNTVGKTPTSQYNTNLEGSPTEFIIGNIKRGMDIYELKTQFLEKILNKILEGERKKFVKGAGAGASVKTQTHERYNIFW